MALREVILTVLAHRRMTGYEIAHDFDRALSYFWRASHQQIYRELASLDKDGCVKFKVVPQTGKPDRKVYAITTRGRDELKKWVAEPTPPPQPRYDLLVKLMAGLLVDKASLHREMERVSVESRAILKQFRRMRRQCAGQPLETMAEYEQSLYLALRRGLLQVEAQTKWLGEVTEFLESGSLKR